MEKILGDRVKAGDVVIVRYEGPRGGPGMQEMLYPTSYIKSKGLGKACALLTDGRFSGGPSGLPQARCYPFIALQGFDLIAAVAGRVQQPRRNIPRAMLGSLGLALLIYLPLLALIVALGSGSESIPALAGEDPEVPVAPAGRHLLG